MEWYSFQSYSQSTVLGLFMGKVSAFEPPQRPWACHHSIFGVHEFDLFVQRSGWHIPVAGAIDLSVSIPDHQKDLIELNRFKLRAKPETNLKYRFSRLRRKPEIALMLTLHNSPTHIQP